MGDPAFALRVVRRWPERSFVVPQQVARVSGGLDLGRPAVLGLAALNAPFTNSTPSAKPVAQCAFSGAFRGGAEHRVVALGSHVDSWLEFGAARLGCGCV